MTSRIEPAAPRTSGPRRVYVHIGVPKSGTTYLQSVLAENREALRRHGYLYPLAHREEMFHAAVDVRGTYDVWGLDRERTRGTWARICRRIQDSGLDGIISHEILSAATATQVEAAVEHLRGLEIHVVLTARDPGRQAAAVWQETVKNGGHLTFGEFQEQLEAVTEGRRSNAPFWRAQDIVAVLDRWASVTTADKVHVVTAPPSGSPPAELWGRFAGAIGLDPDAYETAAAGSGNESLGAAQVALLREVNEALDGRIAQPLYAHVVKRLFAQRILRTSSSRRFGYPAQMQPTLVELAQRWVEAVKQAGYEVHGDLADLEPLPADPDSPGPDEVAAEEKYEVARESIAELLVELARLRGPGGPRDGGSQLRRLARSLIDKLRGG